MVWLIDEFACRYLTSARHTVGLPLAFLLELHGWYAPSFTIFQENLLTKIRWHVFTAIGGYTAVAVIDLVTSGEVTEDPVPGFAWPVPLAARLMSRSASSVKQS